MEEEEEREVLSGSPTPLVVEQRFGGVEFSYLPCLASGKNSNLTSNDMTDVRRQGFAVDDDNGPAPENIPDEVPQLEDGYSWTQEGIIFPR